MSVYCYDCLELRSDNCSLLDMTFAARDRKMIANEYFCYDCLELRSDNCSLGDVILSARDRKMIANEYLLLRLFGAQK